MIISAFSAPLRETFRHDDFGCGTPRWVFALQTQKLCIIGKIILSAPSAPLRAARAWGNLVAASAALSLCVKSVWPDSGEGQLTSKQIFTQIVAFSICVPVQAW
jgi:hypothetical protein